MDDELRETFRARLPSRIEALQAVLRAAANSPEARAEALRHQAHSLKGAGTTFGFPEISAAAQAVEAASPEGLTAAAERLLETLRRAAAGGEAPPTTRLLILDDDPEIVQQLSATLTAPGRDIVTAETVAEATDRLAEGPVDLLILDLVLKDQDGRRVISELRRRADTANLPIFVISGPFGKQLEAECYALGADAYFEKPVDPTVLDAAVSARLERQAAIRASQVGLRRMSLMAAMSPAQPVHPAGAQAAGGTVFLVEDDELIASVVKHRLEREGFTVVHYADGAEAAAAAPGLEPVIAILDVKLPGMDGFELLGLLRTMEGWAQVPVIILTALGDEKDLVRGFALGANDYILKPFSPPELVARVRRLART